MYEVHELRFVQLAYSRRFAMPVAVFQVMRRCPGRVALTVFPRARPPKAERVYNRGSGIVNEK